MSLINKEFVELAFGVFLSNGLITGIHFEFFFFFQIGKFRDLYSHSSVDYMSYGVGDVNLVLWRFVLQQSLLSLLWQVLLTASYSTNFFLVDTKNVENKINNKLEWLKQNVIRRFDNKVEWNDKEIQKKKRRNVKLIKIKKKIYNLEIKMQIKSYLKKKTENDKEIQKKNVKLVKIKKEHERRTMHLFVCLLNFLFFFYSRANIQQDESVFLVIRCVVVNFPLVW